MSIQHGQGKLVNVTSFYSHTLNNKRNITVYLPPFYTENKDKRYSVLYMHDGQGLFQPNPFSNYSWGMYDTLESLILSTKIEPIIVVGIDNMGDERVDEFVHPLSDGTNSAIAESKYKGELYEAFIIHELKPYIDTHYRTLPGREHTALLGSSMAGLVTYHIGLRNPQIFSKLGILSPYFKRLDLNDLTEATLYQKYPKRDDILIWMDIGEVEANILVSHVRDVVDELLYQGYEANKDIYYYEVPNAAHTENDWRERVHLPLILFFGDIGKPNSVKLHGPDCIGVTGKHNKMNPIVSYSSGLITTDLQGHYISGDSSVLTVLQDGTVEAKLSGETLISYKKHGMESSKSIKVVSHLDEFVNVSIRIDVPKGTMSEFLYVGKIKIAKLSNESYSKTFKLPRNTAIQFNVRTDEGIQEIGLNGQSVPFRRVFFRDNMNIILKVKAWQESVNLE